MNDNAQTKDQSPETKGLRSDQTPNVPSQTKDRLPVAAILLAAGRSERMGTFKPLLPFGEKTVIESCLDYLREGSIETIVVVGGHHIDQLRARLRTESVIIAENPDPASEMGHSIACGVKVVPNNFGAVLIALVDHPAVSPNVVHQLIDEWHKGTPLIVPTWQGRGGHPVLVDLRFRSELLSLSPQGGLKSLLLNHRQDVRRLPVDSPFIARDMDTWDDYTRIYSDVFGVKPPIHEESNESTPRAI